MNADMKASTLACVLLLTVLSRGARSQGAPIHSLPNGAVKEAAMVAPNVGWAFGEPTTAGSVLWWTIDGGAQWREITPPMPVPETIISVAFLDTRAGWALLEDVRKAPDSFQFDLASTTSAGAKWEVHPLIIPGLRSKDMRWGYVDGSIAFVDPLHGWMYLMADEPNLLITSDGGKTWQPQESQVLPDGSKHLVLVTPEVAWLRDGSLRGLYVTRDGAKTWQSVSLPPPDEFSKWIAKGSDTIYTDPAFHDSKHGFEVVTYGYSKSGNLSAAVLFETLDGGVSWQARGLLGTLPENLTWPISSTVVDSSWLIARRPATGLPMITILHLGEWENGMVVREAGYGANLPMIFTNPDRGWVLMDGALLATQDGGASWTDVTPDRVLRRFKPAPISNAQ
jgi:photosystem II stability/assembly factor-like uncharacterized protein